jgi:hypothetical protein
MESSGAITLGVVADTHIPDRSPGLHPILLRRFQEVKVYAILHAGDICTPAVLHQLESIAPVYAVRGNRDIFYLRHLPARKILNFGGVTVGLVHGHGSLRDYLLDRVRYYLVGIRVNAYRQRALHSFEACQVIVFGHIHYQINEWVNEQRLLFNPGSACCPDRHAAAPSAGLLHIDPAGKIVGEIFSLD